MRWVDSGISARISGLTRESWRTMLADWRRRRALTVRRSGSPGPAPIRKTRGKLGLWSRKPGVSEGRVGGKTPRLRSFASLRMTNSLSGWDRRWVPRFEDSARDDGPVL